MAKKLIQALKEWPKNMKESFKDIDNARKSNKQYFKQLADKKAKRPTGTSDFPLDPGHRRNYDSGVGSTRILTPKAKKKWYNRLFGKK